MNDEKWLKTRNSCLKLNGINNPQKIDDFVERFYTLMKESDLSIIEAEKILEFLKNKIDQDKMLILREPLITTEKYK